MNQTNDTKDTIRKDEMNDEIKNDIELYISQFTPYEKIAYQIAIKNLETSFCIEKSIGFLEFKTLKK